MEILDLQLMAMTCSIKNNDVISMHRTYIGYGKCITRGCVNFIFGSVGRAPLGLITLTPKSLRPTIVVLLP